MRPSRAVKVGVRVVRTRQYLPNLPDYLPDNFLPDLWRNPSRNGERARIRI